MPIEVIGFIVLAEDDSSSGFGRRHPSDLRYDRERQVQIFEVREPVVLLASLFLSGQLVHLAGLEILYSLTDFLSSVHYKWWLLGLQIGLLISHSGSL